MAHQCKSVEPVEKDRPWNRWRRCATTSTRTIWPGCRALHGVNAQVGNAILARYQVIGLDDSLLYKIVMRQYGMYQLEAD